MNKLLLTLSLIGLSFSIKAQDNLQYTVSFENAVHHEAAISLYIPNVPDGNLILKMSRSSPGRYATHEFGKNIYDVKAFDSDGKELEIGQIEGDVYQIARHNKNVKITYTLFGNWVDGTYAAIDAQHAHLNMPASFLWAPALSNRPITVQFITPNNWKVATQLIYKNGLYHAPNLQYLMDSPTELSNYQQKTWEVANNNGLTQKINIVVHGKTSDSTFNAFENHVKNIVKQAQAVFGELPKFDDGEYKFLIDVLSTNSGDGMEHRNSTIITNKSESLDVSAKRILGTVSHEFFHAWNVERIRPKSLEPFNFEKANMSEALWFAEGFTQYYGELLLARAGVNTPTDFIKTQGRFLNAVLNAPGAQKYSPIFMSKRAVFVDAGVAIDETNHANIFSSYYLYGNITALALDLSLRSQFNLSLDDYMKAVWLAYGKTEIPYTITNLQTTLAQVCNSPDFAEQFFKDYIYSSQKADYVKLLANAGYSLKRISPTATWLGDIRFAEKNNGVQITSPTLKGTPIYLAGLDAGDIIEKIDGAQINNTESLKNFLSTKKAGETINITFIRNSETKSTTLKLQYNPNLEIVSFEDNNLKPNSSQLLFRGNWLNSKN